MVSPQEVLAFRKTFMQECLAGLPSTGRSWFGKLEQAVDSVVEAEAAHVDRSGELPTRSLDALRELGVLGVQIPASYGGLGLDDATACLVVERVARSCCSTAALLMFHFQVVRRTLSHGGAFREEDLRGFASGELLASSAWTEANSGPDKSDISTVLVESGDGLRLTGAKTFCTGAPLAGVIHVLVDHRVDGASKGSTFVRVNAGDPRLSISEPYALLGLRGSGTATVTLDGVPVGAEDLVGPPGSGAALMRENHEVALNPGLLALGTAASAFDEAIRVLPPHRLQNASVQDAIAASVVELESAYSLAAQTVGLPVCPTTSVATGKLKMWATSVAESVTGRLLQVVGSQAFTSKLPIERKLRDARATTLMGPSNDLIKRRIVDAASNHTISVPATVAVPAKRPVHSRPELIGVGYLHHCIPEFQAYHRRLRELGAPLDMIEFLGTQFHYDPDYLGEINVAMGSLPSTLHSYEYMLGSVEGPARDVIARLQRMARVSNCRWIGEHIGMVGTADSYSGTFMQPFGTDEQTQQFIENLRSANEESVCPLIVENQSQLFAQVGPRSIGEQVADIAIGADTGILLSLSNIIISDSFYPMDRDAELASIPLERVWQVHVPVPCEAELDEPRLAKLKHDAEWAYSTLEELFRQPDFHPAAVILEVEAAGTPSRAEPEQTRDRLMWARELLGLALTAPEPAA